MSTWKRMGVACLLLTVLILCGGLLIWLAPGLLEKRRSENRPTARLLVRARQPRITSGGEEGSTEFSREELARYRKTQLNLMKSRRVLSAALLQPDVAQLGSIKQGKEPISWLQEKLDARFPDDSEVLEISLVSGTGLSREDQARVINAVQAAYLDEVVNSDLKQRKERQESLKRWKQTYADLIKSRRQTLRAHQQSAGLADSTELALRRDATPHLYQEVRLQQIKLQMEQAEAETLLARRKKASGPAATEQVRKEISQLEDRLSSIQAQQKVLAEVMADLQKQAAIAAQNTQGLADLQDELRQYQEQSDKISRDLEMLNVELQAPPRISRFELATP